MSDISRKVEVPTILFTCTHNAGRSQMAAGWASYLGGNRVRVLSGGSQPVDDINQAAVVAMKEIGINLDRQRPRKWTDDAVQQADVIVSMGCGDACPVYPAKRYEDWDIPDPAGRPLEAVRQIRDEIGDRVRQLLAEISKSVASHDN